MDNKQYVEERIEILDELRTLETMCIGCDLHRELNSVKDLTVIKNTCDACPIGHVIRKYGDTLLNTTKEHRERMVNKELGEINLDKAKANKRGKRYYEIGETVWVKATKELGVITDMKIEPELSIFKVLVEVKSGNVSEVIECNLWEIDKDKNTFYKELRKKNVKKNTDEQPIIYFAKVRDNAIIPSKDEENGGYDIYANFDEEEISIAPNEVKMIPTGIASSVEKNWVLIAKERGSTGAIAMSLKAGVVDSGYRGEIFIMINNTSNKKIVISKVDVPYADDAVVYPYAKAIAQLLLIPVPDAKVIELPYEELKKITSKRGDGALGSSGK